MFNQFITICLEKPEKLERILSLFLRTLVTIIFLNLFLGSVYPGIAEEIRDAGGILNGTILSRITLVDILMYVVLFVLMWILLWAIVAEIILVAARLPQYSIQLLLFLFGGLIRLIRLIPCFRKTATVNDRESNYQLKGDAKYFYETLYLFRFIDEITGSRDGSEMLYLIIEHEKTNFIKSRIISYYTVLVLGTLGFGLTRPDLIDGFYWIVVIILCFLGMTVVIIKEVHRDLQHQKLIELREALKRQLFLVEMSSVIEHHPVFSAFKAEMKRRMMHLKMETHVEGKSANCTLEVQQFYEGLESLSITSKIQAMAGRINTVHRVLIVSNVFPDLALRNYMEANEIYFVYATNENELYSGLSALQTVITHWTANYHFSLLPTP